MYDQMEISKSMGSTSVGNTAIVSTPKMGMPTLTEAMSRPSTDGGLSLPLPKGRGTPPGSVAVYPHVTGDNAMRGPSVDVTALAQQIAALPVQTLFELAAAIAMIDAPTADRFADRLIVAAYDVRQAEKFVAVVHRGHPKVFIDPSEYDYSDAVALPSQPPLSPNERFAQNVLQRVADEDCRYQLAWTQ